MHFLRALFISRRKSLLRMLKLKFLRSGKSHSTPFSHFLEKSFPSTLLFWAGKKEKEIMFSLSTKGKKMSKRKTQNAAQPKNLFSIFGLEFI